MLQAEVRPFIIIIIIIMDKFTVTHWYSNPSSNNEQKDIKLAT